MSTMFTSVVSLAGQRLRLYGVKTQLVVLEFNDTSTLWVILCRLPEKGRQEIEDSRRDEREGQGRKRNRNEREETEDKNIPTYPYQLQG